MYVPTDLLMPILADLIANGAVGGNPKPWIGLNTQPSDDGLMVSRVDAQQPGGEGRFAACDLITNIARRHAEDTAGFLSQALVARFGWRDRAAGSYSATDKNQHFDVQVDRPHELSQVEEYVLTSIRREVATWTSVPGGVTTGRSAKRLCRALNLE